jgi:TOMM system kinase/cyclase fusion protein
LARNSRDSLTTRKTDAPFDAPTSARLPSGVEPAGRLDVTPVADPAANPPAPGERFGENDRFEIVEKLGVGGMGYVFRALDRHLDRTVAIKFVLHRGSMPLDQLVAMLRREAKATAKLHHENIVAIFDMDTYRGMPFLVMELLDGQSLDVMLERSRLSPLRATQIMKEVAAGLTHAHVNGIVHRDLKPSNVFILRDGRAKILDFGISRSETRVTPAQVADDAATSAGFGTPAFMAPEQWRGDAQDTRTDIWSAGVMFYQLLTGKLPYTVAELQVKFQSESRKHSLAPSVRLIVPALAEEADRLVATALSEDPQGRFQTAREMAEALGELERVIASRSSGAAPQIERRPLSILACQLDVPEDLEFDEGVDAEQRFLYDTAVRVVKQADGAVGTPVGGKFFCCFGYPVKGNDAQRAVWSALEIAEAMRERAQRGGAGFEFRIGVHSGIVGIPATTGPSEGIPAMQGQVPNVAVRLADGAPAGSVVMSQATYDLTSGFFTTEKRSVDGGSDRTRPAVYEVIGEVESYNRFEAFSAQLTPFVGRDTEFSLLHGLWDEAKQGRGQIAVVRGEPGIGKSRLVQTLRDRVIEEHNIRLTCQCRPHFKNSTLHPLVELILRSVNIQRHDTPADKLAKLEKSLSPLGFVLADAVPLFGALLAVPFEPQYAPLGLTPEQQKIKTLEAMVSMLLRTASSRPALFIIEDMQWVDHSTIEYLNALIDHLPSSRLLVVLTSRLEFRVPWSERPHLHQVTLDRLSPAITLSIIERAAKDKGLSPEMIERLVTTTDGVPLFVEELTRMVVESWQPSVAGQTASMAIPGTLHELLLAKLDMLRGVGKEVAQVASTLGRDFPYELIRHVSPVDEISLLQGLETLVEADILRHSGRLSDSKYVFKHALIQQAAYQSLGKTERQRHHRRAAEALTEFFAETAEQQPELVAHHHAEAGNPREAMGFWEKAGQRATERSALVEAIDHYTKAGEALKTQPEDLQRDKKELGLLLAVGSPLMSVHGYASPDVEKVYARARELARIAGGQAEIFPAMLGLWQFYYVRGMLPTSRQLGHELLDIARESGSLTFLLLAHRAVASSAFLQGDYETCRTHAQAGFDIYNVKEHGALALRTGHDPGVAHGVYLAWSLWMLGYPDQAHARVMEMVELADTLNHPMTIAYAKCFAALICNHRGDHEEALALAEAALEITVANKFALWSAWARMQIGWGLAGRKDRERGISLMQAGLDDWKATGARVGFTIFSVTLAEMCLHAGRYADTTRLLAEAAPMVANNDEHFYEPELRRLEGELCLATAGERTGAVAEAAAHFARGLEVARALSGKSWELRVAASRARLLAEHGEPADAVQMLRDTLRWFTEGFETGDVRAARSLLETIVASM